MGGHAKKEIKKNLNATKEGLYQDCLPVLVPAAAPGGPGQDLNLQPKNVKAASHMGMVDDLRITKDQTWQVFHEACCRRLNSNGNRNIEPRSV